MAFFTMMNRNEEAVACTVIFVVSIFYIVIKYEPVNDQSLFGDTEGVSFDIGASELSPVIDKWRWEFDHPCVVSKNR